MSKSCRVNLSHKRPKPPQYCGRRTSLPARAIASCIIATPLPMPAEPALGFCAPSPSPLGKKLAYRSRATIEWRKEYGGLEVDQAKRMKELERENVRLKRLSPICRWRSRS